MVTVTEQDTLQDVVDLLSRHRFGGLLVVDGAGKLRGAISATDIVQFARSVDEKPLVNLSRWFSPKSEDLICFIRKKSREAMKKARVKEAMNENIVTTGEDENIKEPARMMKRHRTNLLHIVDDQGRITGIVTRSDILLGLSKHS